MIRLLLPLLLALAVSCKLPDKAEVLEDLEELEDLLVRGKHMRAYSNPAKERTPYGLLNQFNTARQSTVSRRKLQSFLEKLEEGHPIVNMLSEDEVEERIAEIRAMLGDRATSQVTCPTTNPEYRTMDGTCNNLDKVEQGSAGSPLKRVMSNAYDDGLSTPRTMSVTGEPLPGARDVSRTVFGNGRNMNGKFTTLGMNFGQLLDHDVTQLQSPQEGCSDCSVDGECFPIIIDESDPIFGGKHQCFALQRSDFETDNSGIRHQTNFLTSYLDASFVYGSDDMTADELRDENGLLKHLTDKNTGRDLLPPDKDLPFCSEVDEEANIYCGLAGDSRAAEQPGLTAMHVLFLREHNRIAKQLSTLDSSLSGDEIYQRARKILGAEWQHIVYNEYVPLMVGVELYHSEQLSPSAPYEYDPEVDASISNVFSAAAFRLGHTQVPFNMRRPTSNYNQRRNRNIEIKEAFFNATYMFDESIEDGAADSILRGMTLQSSYNVDGQFSDAIANNLFGDPQKQGDGFDLPSLNIQRGRDHGLPGYTTFRTDFCGLSEISSMRQLRDDNIMSGGDWRRLRSVYGDNVKDIDAFVGLIMESRLPNTLVGPTLACVLADQFHRLKFGDRFFYKNPEHFTQAQMDEIEKASMARLMCDNVEITKIQPYMFYKAKNFQSLSGGSEKRDRSYKSFYEYSRSGTWPHSRASALVGLDNSRVDCTSDMIPAVDLTKFI